MKNDESMTNGKWQMKGGIGRISVSLVKLVNRDG